MASKENKKHIQDYEIKSSWSIIYEDCWCLRNSACELLQVYWNWIPFQGVSVRKVVRFYKIKNSNSRSQAGKLRTSNFKCFYKAKEGMYSRTVAHTWHIPWKANAWLATEFGAYICFQKARYLSKVNVSVWNIMSSIMDRNL